jgi:S-adenosylmethionine uptake transporter
MNIQTKSYIVGIAWFIASMLMSVSNDIISKYMGLRLHSFEVSFFRFLFSTIILIPFIFYQGIGSLKTSRPIIHLARGFLLFLGMTSWTFGLTVAPVTTATIFSFSIPLFTLVLAVFFLKENIIWQRWVVVIIAFIGLIVTLKPHSSDFNPYVLIFIFASISFSMLDIINKKFIIEESMISMLFYSAIITSICSVPAMIPYWQTPTIYELSLLFLLGSGGSLILFFILKAFAKIDATAVAPYRYLELLISSTAAYFIFSEIPDDATIYGAVIIIPATLFIIYSETKIKSKT